MSLTKAQQFFYREAGYSYDPAKETERQGRERGARRLAKAEREAREAGLRFVWETDTDGCIGCTCESNGCKCFTEEPHECLVCLAYDAEGTLAGSMGGVCEPTQAYRRVVEAELALEAGVAA